MKFLLELWLENHKSKGYFVKPFRKSKRRDFKKEVFKQIREELITNKTEDNNGHM